ncbi:hypothetical protein ACOMHN_014548 [Nucella lapillus]
MAFFDRHSSAPSLHNLDDDTHRVIRNFSTDFSDEDSIVSDPYHYPLKASASAELCTQSFSESEHSPVNIRKKRRAPPPPCGPPPPYPSPGSLRHSYAFEHSHNRASSDSDSLALSMTTPSASSRLVYQNSTDSENVPDPDSSLGLASSDQEHSSSHLGLPSPGKDRSRLRALKNALRSPNILRKSSRREEGKEEDAGKASSRSRKHATVEVPVPLSEWCTMAFVSEDLWDADSEFEIKRIPDYDKYLSDLLDDTDDSHPDHEDLSKAASRVRAMVKEREEEERKAEQEEHMDTIQDRFPFDDLQLKDRDQAQANKGRSVSLRRLSAPSAVVFRSIGGGRSRSSSVLWPQGTMGRKDDSMFSIRQSADTSRRYIMEDPVQFAMGMQTQERYLFLLNDLLLVAKQKNSTMFKLKKRVPLCDMWLSHCIDDVTELTRAMERSIVIGWPTTNVVATFRDTLTKDKWLNKLTERIQEDKQVAEPKEIPLKVVLRDGNKTCELTVGNTQQAKDVLLDCCTQLNISDSDSKDYKLWVWSDKDSYPLIGHEVPYCIRVSHLREVGRSRGEENMTLEELGQVASEQPSNTRVDFFLRQKKTPKKHSLDEVSHKSMKKSKKSSPLLNIFKRAGREDKANNNIPAPVGKLFGLPLASVSLPDDAPPKPITDFLSVLCRDGPKFVGILRKNANAKYTRELRFRLDQGLEVEEVSAVVAGGLIKDYLRSLPDPLLMEALHNEWLQVGSLTEGEEKVQHIKHLLSQMPACNVGLLKRLLCALHHVEDQSEENKMNAYNLSLCIAPSLLWHKDPLALSGAAPAVEFMIKHCVELFGPEVLMLLQDPSSTKSRPDSGTDSDSYHSVLSIPETGNSDSIDSLVDRELFTAEGEGDGEEEEECEAGGPPVTKSHLSPSNLSRDSGLTLSDTQLYDDDCAEHHHHSHHHDSRLAFRPHHHRSAMNFTDRDDDESDSYHPEPSLNPVPPPRKKGKPQGSSSSGGHATRMDSGGGGRGIGIRGRDQRHTLHASMSSSRLLDHHAEDSISTVGSAALDSLRSTRTLPSFSSLADAYKQAAVMNREKLREYDCSSDIGLLRKSASGAHLILNDETLSRKCSEASLTGGGVVFRQSSGVDSTPPQSPQSKYSYSSRDSVISDSSQGAISRDSSVTSAPQTPDMEYADRLPPWLPALDLEYGGGGGEGRLAHSLNLVSSGSRVGGDGGALSASDSASQLRGATAACGLQMAPYLGDPPSPESPVSDEAESQDLSPLSLCPSRAEHALQPSSSLPWEGRSREAEDVTSGSSPQVYITQCASTSEERLDEPVPEEATPRSSPSSSADVLPLELAHGHSSLPMKQMSRYSHNLAKVSPPPRVLLQSLRSPRSRMDFAPVRASHDSDIIAQVQRAGFSSPRPEEEDGSEDDDEQEKEAGEDEHPSTSGLDEGVAGSTSEGSFSAQGFDAAQSMEAAINDTEYIPVKPRLAIIRREESIHSNASTHSSASSASSSTGKSSLSSLTLSTSPSARSSSSTSSGGSSVTLAGDHARPSRPPEYAEAVKRSLILKQEHTVEAEAEAQIEASRKAKYLFEKSNQLYLQDRPEHTQPLHRPLARKISDPGTTRNPLGVVGGARGRFEAEHPRCASPPDYVAASATEKPYHADIQKYKGSACKQPFQMYKESVQRYEQQQTGPVPAGGLPSRITEPSSRATEPTTRSTEPSTRSTEPAARSVEPSSRSTELTPRSVEPVERSPEPTTRSAEPTTKSAEPMTRTTELATKTIQPASFSAGNSAQTDFKPSAKQGNGIVAEDRTKPETVHVAETRVQLRSANNRTIVPKDARPRSMLDIPASSVLHQSFSDSADRLNKLGLHNSPGRFEAKDADSKVGGGVQSVISAFRAVEQKSRSLPPGRKLSDTTVCERPRNGSEPPNPPRQSVLSASCFYHPEDSPRSGRSSPASFSPRAPSPHPDLGTPRASRADSGAGRAGTRSPRLESPVVRASRVFNAPSTTTTTTSTHSAQVSASVRGSTEQSSPRASLDSSAGASSSARDGGSKSRSQLGWSVKNLAKIYTADANTSSEQAPRDPSSRGSQASSGSLTGPPPYQNPPPFRRLHDKSRLSTSSSSSTASSSTTRSGSPTVRGSAASSRKEGPQSVDSIAGDEQSARRFRARSNTGGSGVSDPEPTNPFTDISYV